MEMGKTPVVPNTEENAGRCLCPECPAHNPCMKKHQEVLYCSKGSSSCEFEKWGCLCPRCPVQLEYKTVGLFYCEKGAIKK
jgi:hypothetical protein